MGACVEGMGGVDSSDDRRGWKWLSRNLVVSLNMRACNMGVYASRSRWEEGGMKERLSMRQAYSSISNCSTV